MDAPAPEPAGPEASGDLARDRVRFAEFWRGAAARLAALPSKPRRDPDEAAAAAAVLDTARAARERFLAAHAEAVHDEITDGRTRFLRIEELVDAAAEAIPGLVPARAEVEFDAAREQRDKEGVEFDHGVLLAHLLAREGPVMHLCHAMLLPRADAAEAAARFAADGRLDLGTARIERAGDAVVLTAANPEFLNAEDDTTLDRFELAVDVATLDPASTIAVLRGAPLDHPKHRGRRAFGAGVNLTHLYRGRIPFLWFLRREMGPLHKLLRGVARPETLPDDVGGHGAEKPWVAAIGGFAIGGHCQVLLTMDYVLAADDAFLTLPARKEGIVPGLANLRLPRFTGETIARQLIQAGRRLECASPEGRMICDEIVPAAEMDAAIARTVADLSASGLTSAVANRRASRVGREPLDLFRRYCAVYAREQARCLFGPDLIANLERNWPAKARPQAAPASPAAASGAA